MVAHDVASEVELVFERLETQRARYTLRVVDETDVLSQVGDVTVDPSALGARARVQRVRFERVHRQSDARLRLEGFGRSGNREVHRGRSRQPAHLTH